jgi:protocatechuate 3,4-dioxygenase beta subunit
VGYRAKPDQAPIQPKRPRCSPQPQNPRLNRCSTEVTKARGNNTIKHATLSRRRFLTNTLATATSLHLARHAFALNTPVTCTLNPEQEVGPFYVANELLRSNIAENKPGIPLQLRIAILDARTCTPIPNAAIDLWHCDAVGLYSGFTKTSLGPPPGGPGDPERGHGGPPPEFDPNHPHHHPDGPPPGGPGGPPMMKPTDKLTFLRGIQLTGPDGAVAFQTIFPGFYQGRVNHIHFKVRIGGRPDQKTYEAGHTSHVGQIFFPEDLTARLMATEPYASHHIHRTTQAEDGIFIDQHGDRTISHISQLQPKNLSAGFHADLTVAVDPTATPAPVAAGPPNRID